MDNLKSEFENFDDNWSTVTEPTNDVKPLNADDTLYSEDIVNSKSDNSQPKRIKKSSPVLFLQLLICIIILIGAFSIKTFAPEYYAAVKGVYDTEIKASLYFDGDVSKLDYSYLFAATPDEI
ncbi:MAG: hypothetical protein IJC86_02860 [Clostridia bacterium]|nr:hypothetical protein [Clostridia bacterium]